LPDSGILTMLRDIQVSLGLSQDGNDRQMNRANESSDINTRTSASRTLDRIKLQLGLREKTEMEELQEQVCPKLTFEQRMMGFIGCFACGIVLTLTSMFSFTKLVLGYPRDFAIKYTFGNIIAIASSCFLMGPMRQLRNMSAESRWIAASIYLGAMVMTLVAAFGMQHAEITVLCIILQFCAGVWYMLSYIPFGRKMLAKCCKSLIDEE